ncbi:MAG: AraC family transcriptional regulator [Deltaproteobacteria bacterium]|nr:AraC family transcriptional regulator [Deltaproteobacteria bacterium]
MARARSVQMRSQLVAPVLARVREAGADAAALARRFGVPADAAGAAEVALPLATLRALLDAAAEASADPFLGLHVAARMPRGAYGVLEYSCRSAPTVREALTRIVRYIALLNELVTITFEEPHGRGAGAGTGVIEQRIAGEPECVGRHGNEFFVATVLGGVRQLTGAPCLAERAWFAHAAPPDTSELEQFLGTSRLRWRAGGNGVALATEVLELPLLTSDPPLLSLLDRTAAQALAGRPAQSRLLGHVRQRIRDSLAEAPPTLEAVASALKMSPRSLQRHLAEEGVSFRALVEDARQELALEYVRDPRRPLGEIAFLLGYTELSPFLRAFKRWTGKTPSGFRAG